MLAHNVPTRHCIALFLGLYEQLFLATWRIYLEYFTGLLHWGRSASFTTASIFKLRLPVQWDIGTHCKGPSRKRM